MERFLVTLGTVATAAIVCLAITSSPARGGGSPPAPPPAPVPGAAPDVATAPSAPGAPKAVSGAEVDWATLTAYEYQAELKGLPDPVKALEGKTVTMRGFLMPLYEFDDIHEFVLVPNHMSCCFGMPAGINGQVQVKLSSARGLPNTNEPLEVKGTFHAVETKEQGYLLSIWRLDVATAKIVGY